MSSLVKDPGGELDQGAAVAGVSWTVDPAPGLGVVLTNRCDFANGKVGYLMVAGMLRAKDIIQGSSEFLQLVEGVGGAEQLSKAKSEKLSRFLESKIFNKDIGRYFLLEAGDLGLQTMLVDFQLLTSIPFDTEAATPKVVGRITSPDREHLVTRFAAYSMRIGVDRLAGSALESVKDDLTSPWLLDS